MALKWITGHNPSENLTPGVKSPWSCPRASLRRRQISGCRLIASLQPCGPRCAANGRSSHPGGSSLDHKPLLYMNTHTKYFSHRHSLNSLKSAHVTDHSLRWERGTQCCDPDSALPAALGKWWEDHIQPKPWPLRCSWRMPPSPRCGSQTSYSSYKSLLRLSHLYVQKTQECVSIRFMEITHDGIFQNV